MVNALADAALLYGALALQAVLLVKLWRFRLLKRYPILTAYLTFSLLRGAALLFYLRSPAGIVSRSYAWLYVLSRPILWVFYFLIVLELFSLMLEQYQGLRRLGRLILLAALATATALSCVTLLLDDRGGFDPVPFFSYLALEERSIFLCLSVLMFLLVLFASHYQLPIRRNVWILSASFGGYFVLDTVVFALYRHFGAEFVSIRDLANACFHTLAVLGSVLFVSSAGEKETQLMPVLWGSERRELEASLLLQLQNFNQVLTKVLRQ